MANDATREVRRAGLTTLKADADLIALVPTSQIHPQAPLEAPLWPFVKWGASSVIPRRAPVCLDGCEVTVAVHGFSKGRWLNDALIETAEDHAARIGKAVANALGGKRVEMDEGWAVFTWAGSQLLMDGAEAGAFHSVQNFSVRVTA